MEPTDYKSLLAITATVILVAIASSFVMAQERDDGQFLSVRIVAIGIPGISAVSPVGTFLPGGPIHDKPVLAVFTQPGRVLDPARILVASTSNFGEALANAARHRHARIWQRTASPKINQVGRNPRTGYVGVRGDLAAEGRVPTSWYSFTTARALAIRG